MLRILIVEDEAHNRTALTDLIKRLGHESESAVDGVDGLEKVSKRHYDLILSDVRMPRMDGLQFFENVFALHATKAELLPAFAFMTAYGQVGEAVEAMRKGAMHFLVKPLRKKDVSALLAEVEELRDRRELASRAASAAVSGAVFVSKSFTEVVRLIDKVAASQASVLLIGESGTGKEVLARRLHDSSARAKGAFVAFHSGATPESLIESELFGHERGAFTGADQPRAGLIRQSHGGTFFWDELSSMPSSIQPKLLRVLQDREVQALGAKQPVHVDVRWVAASNEPLGPLVAQGRFREDLLYRLSVVVVDLPPLRARPEDIEVLTAHFIAAFAEREGRPEMTLPESTRRLLGAYAWPGNVRELKNVVERAFVLASGTEFGPELLPAHIASDTRAREIQVALGSSLESVEDRLIEETLRFCEGDKNRAAQILGVAPRTIYRWLERRILERP